MDISPELIARYSINGPRYTSYPTAAEFRNDFPATEWQKILRAEALDKNAAFYIHLPFCHSLCYFCACHKVISASHEPVARYIQALSSEIRLYSLLFEDRVTVDHLHLGGGTPNFLSAGELEALIEQFNDAFPNRTDDAELSIELDPRTVSPEHVHALAYLGFTRISCGVQDFDPRVQEAINRRQSYEQTRELVDSARQLGIEDVNIDLIYGLPQQTLSGFEQTLSQVIFLRPERIALYGYAHLPSREKVQVAFRRFPLPAPCERIALFSLAVEQLTSAGYEFIGMDHFALACDPLAQAQKNGTLRRNFMGYTDRVGEPLIGFGASAISSVTGAFAQNEKKIAEYEQLLLAEGRSPVRSGIVRTRDDRIRAEVIERLMCDRRVQFENLSLRWGINFEDYFGGSLPELAELESEGLIQRTEESIEVTPSGRFFLRNIAMSFDSYLPTYRKAAKPIFSQAV